MDGLGTGNQRRRSVAPFGDTGDPPGWEKLLSRRLVPDTGFCVGSAHVVDLEGQGG